MTRQKQMLIDKINALELDINLSIAMGHGYYPAHAFDHHNELIHGYEEELAKLRHYKSAAEMEMDPRPYEHMFLPDEDIPFA